MATEPREYVEGSSSLVLGVDSYTKPDELGAMELVMAMNCQVRGGIVQTRPGSKTLFCPPRGNMQGMTQCIPDLNDMEGFRGAIKIRLFQPVIRTAK